MVSLVFRVTVGQSVKETTHTHTLCPSSSLALHQTLAHENARVYDAALQPFRRTLAAGVRRPNVFAHVLNDVQQLGVFADRRLRFRWLHRRRHNTGHVDHVRWHHATWHRRVMCHLLVAVVQWRRRCITHVYV